MKNRFMLTLTVLLLAAGCTDRFPSSYVLELPEVPAAWVSLLGEPHWRFEWVNPGGLKQIADFPPDDSLARLEIEIPASWTNPV
ncbi:MAG: hypothetical protein LBC80_05075, partial [Treponema sp.]|nr:hypothetical protein [Treponema sp.]